MATLQQQITAELGVRQEIDPAAEIRRRIDFLKEYLGRTALNGYVHGISGGQDSTLVGMLAQQAVAELREEGKSARFVALRLPYAVQSDEEDAQLALKFIDPDETYTLDIARATDGITAEMHSRGIEVSDFNKGNIKARERMVAHYAIAGEWGLAVLGSDHAAEAVTGFYTKFGDGAADVMPLFGLTKRQGRDLLIAAGSPPPLYEKVPTADLLDEDPGQTDEDALGVTYPQIDDYLEGKPVPAAAQERIEHLYLASRHKRHLPVRPQDDWWRD